MIERLRCQRRRNNKDERRRPTSMLVRKFPFNQVTTTLIAAVLLILVDVCGSVEANGVTDHVVNANLHQEEEQQMQQQSSKSHGANGFVHDPNDKLLLDLANWVQNTPGAVISDKIQMRKHPTKPIRGVFATQDIEEDEVLISIPWSIIIAPSDEIGEEQIYTTNYKPEEIDWYADHCYSIQAVYDEMMSDNPTPYGTYLKQQPRGYLPGLWSTAGKEYFDEIMPEWLPPRTKIANHVHRSFWVDCQDILGLPDLEDDLEGDKDGWESPVDNYDEDANREAEGIDMEMMLHAWMMIIARAEDESMIPIYDMFNHQNGDLLNTEHDFEEDEYFALIASKDIAAGDELYNSYNQCGPCGDRRYRFGTADMFLSYGFVENYPQRYIIDWDTVRFKFDITRDESDDPEEDESWDVSFLAPLSPDAVKFMTDSVRALQMTKVVLKPKGKPDDVPQKEFDAAWQLHEAHLLAFKVALVASKDSEISNKVWTMSNYWYWPGWEYLFHHDDEDSFEAVEELDIQDWEDEDDEDDEDEDEEEDGDGYDHDYDYNADCDDHEEDDDGHDVDDEHDYDAHDVDNNDDDDEHDYDDDEEDDGHDAGDAHDYDAHDYGSDDNGDADHYNHNEEDNHDDDHHGDNDKVHEEL